jgi:hypothetical protein
LVFGNTLAPVKLIGAAPDLRVDGVFVYQQPTILFFLRFEKAEQRFLRAGGTGRLNLLLDSSLQGRIVDFDVHGPDCVSAE